MKSLSLIRTVLNSSHGHAVTDTQLICYSRVKMTIAVQTT